MRHLLFMAAALAAVPCLAQDTGQMAAMQAQQTAMQQNDLINQQITQQNILNAQLANQTAADMSGYQYGAMKPSVKVQPGSDASHVVVRLKDRTRGALIFYTTDGWTPTPASARYQGPITLQPGTVLRAVAIAPGSLRSGVTVWPVAAPGQTATKPKFVDRLEGVASGESLSDSVTLVFAAPVISKGMQVGDRLPVVLAGDLRRGGKVVAPKGTAALATIAQIDGTASFGRPAEVTFLARSLELADGTVVKLVGGERLEGEPHEGRAASLFFVPVVGLVNGSLVHGDAADIPQGAVFPATVIWPKMEGAHNDVGQ